MQETSFWKKSILIFTFFLLTPIAVGISLFSLTVLADVPIAKPAGTLAQETGIDPKVLGVQVYASLPNLAPAVSGTVGVSDARVELIRQYMSYYNSPLASYSDLIVATADKYNLDFRLIPAIAQQESNLCKKIPPGSFNCWGWGIHSAGTLFFDSYEEGIETVSQGLRENYLNLGLNTPKQIMTKYTPLSQGSWALGVETFMSEMQ